MLDPPSNYWGDLAPTLPTPMLSAYQSGRSSKSLPDTSRKLSKHHELDNSRCT